MNAMEEEAEGLPKPAREDLIISLCESNYSFAQFESVKKLKLSQAGMIMVRKEKEAYKIWKQRIDNEN
jgi:hypothetical protein